jgi:hypothetical protein
MLSLLKRAAVKFDLIPGSLKLRAYLKRIFIGKTFPLPSEINEGMADYLLPDALNTSSKNTAYKIFYIVGNK